MQRFSFRLENVLRIRKKIEEGVQRDFGRALSELMKAEEELNLAVKKLKRFIRENPLNEGVFSAYEIIAIDSYIARIEREIKNLFAVRAEKEEVMERVRGLLMEARKARKVMENLKRRKLERYFDDLNREENLELDDVNQKIGLNREKLSIEDLPIEET